MIDWVVVEVVWFDAQSSLSSFTLKEVREDLKPVYTKSCGYLIHDDDESVILGFMIFDDDVVKHLQCIPKGMIKSVKVLRKGKK